MNETFLHDVIMSSRTCCGFIPLRPAVFLSSLVQIGIGCLWLVQSSELSELPRKNFKVCLIVFFSALWVVVSGTVGVIGSLSKSTNAVFLYFIMLILCQVMTVANIAINYHVITDNFEVGFHLTYLLSITSDSQNSMSIDIYSRHHVYMALSVVHIIFLCFFVVIAHSLLGVYEAGGTGYEMLCAEDILAGCKTLKEAKELEGNTQKPGVCSRLCPWLCKNWFEPNEVEQDEIDPPALIGGDESDFDSTSNTTVKDFKDEETQPLRWRTSRYDMIVTK